MAVALGGIVASLGIIIFSLAPSTEIGYLGRLLAGAGFTPGFLGAVQVSAQLFLQHRSGAAGVMSALCSLPLLFAAKEDRQQRRTQQQKSATKSSVDAPGNTCVLWIVISSWKNWALAMYGAVMGGPRLSFLATWAMPTMQAFQPGLSVGSVGAAVSCSYVAMIGCTPLWGFIADKLDRHGAVMFVTACTGLGSLVAVVLMGDTLPLLA